MEVKQNSGNFNICLPCGAPPLVRDFLMPGIIHYMKSVFTRYQLVIDLFQGECEAAAEEAKQNERTKEAEGTQPEWLSALGHTAHESAAAYSFEVEPFVLLVNTLYTSPELIAKKFPLNTRASEGLRVAESSRETVKPSSAAGSSEPAASIMTELLKNSAAFAGAQINISPGVAELSRNYCCRMFGPISSGVYLMIKEGGAERVEIGVLEEGGTLSLTISSKAELHRKTTEVLEGCGCTGVDSGSGKDSPCMPCSVVCSYSYSCTKGTGTLVLPAFRGL